MLRILKYSAILSGICTASGAVAESLPPAGVPRTDQSIPLSTNVFSADHPLWTFELAKAGYVEEEYLPRRHRVVCRSLRVRSSRFGGKEQCPLRHPNDRATPYRCGQF